MLDRVKHERPAQLNGIVEADERLLLESQQGACTLDREPPKLGGKTKVRGVWRQLDCILVSRELGGQTIDAVTGPGSLKAAQLVQHLLTKLAPQALLMADSHAAYRCFAQRHGMAHEAVNLRAGVRVRAGASGAIHVQNVHAYHRRFREWLAHFHGIASRWLPSYLRWHWALDGGRVTSVEQLLRIALGVINS